jgi:hypothetical protein
MIRNIVFMLCLTVLSACQSTEKQNQLTSGTWMGYGMGVTEYSGKLTR